MKLSFTGTNEKKEIAPQAPVRVMQIMEYLGVAQQGLSLTRLAEKLEVPKSTLLSFLRTLESAGYVKNHEGVYRIGEQGIRLGTVLSAANPFPRSLHEALLNVRDDTQETALLAILIENDTVSYVDMVESDSAIRFSATIGSRRPLHCTAAGKAFLSTMDATILNNFASIKCLTSYTKNTICNFDSLLVEIEKIRHQGFSETKDEHSIGVSGFGACIRDAKNNVVAALVIAAPTHRAIEEHDRLSEAVIKHAGKMSRILGNGQ